MKFFCVLSLLLFLSTSSAVALTETSHQTCGEPYQPIVLNITGIDSNFLLISYFTPSGGTAYAYITKINNTMYQASITPTTTGSYNFSRAYLNDSTFAVLTTKCTISYPAY